MKSSDLTPYQRLVPLYDPVDLNTLRTPGCYSIFSNQIVNGPFGNASLTQAVVVVERAGGNNLAQVIYDGMGNIYYRIAAGLIEPPLVFFPWRQIIDNTIPLVNHFNGRTGDVVLGSADVINALGYTPRNSADALVESFNGRTGDVALAGPDVTGALGYTPAGMWDTPPNQNLNLLINGGMYHVDANPVNGPPGLAGQYSQLLVVHGAGGSMWQMLTSMGSVNIWYRTGIPTSPPTWDPWRQIIDSNVALVNSFNGRTGAVSLTGGDVTNALGYTPISKAMGDTYYPAIGHYPTTGVNLNSIVNGGMYRIGADPVNGPPGNVAQYSQLLVVRGAVDTIWQMVVNYENNQLWYRAGNPPEAGGSGVWKPWQQVFSNMPYLLGNPGYIILPNGIIAQWGTLYGIPTGTSGPYYFPMAFPNGCASLVFTGQTGYKTNASLNNNSSFNVYLDGSNLTASYIAIGY